jgi:hypothetical protein
VSRPAFDRRAYDQAIAEEDEALDAGDTAGYYRAVCAQKEAQGGVPRLADVARAFGLPAPSKAAVARFEDDVVDGRIPLGTTAEQIRRQLLAGGSRSRVDFPSARERSWHLGEERARAALPLSAVAPQPARGRVGPVERAEPDNEPAETLAWADDFTIRLSVGALSAIENEIRDAIWRFDVESVETGGWLYGLYGHGAHGGDDVIVVHATGPGPEAVHGRDRVKLSHPSTMPFDGALVGSWHSHPSRWSGDPNDQASDADLEAWHSHRVKLCNASRHIGVIFTPDLTMGWTSPQFHGYLVGEDEDGRRFCLQATVEEHLPWL